MVVAGKKSSTKKRGEQNESTVPKMKLPVPSAERLVPRSSQMLLPSVPSSIVVSNQVPGKSDLKEGDSMAELVKKEGENLQRESNAGSGPPKNMPRGVPVASFPNLPHQDFTGHEFGGRPENGGTKSSGRSRARILKLHRRLRSCRPGPAGVEKPHSSK